jgi:HK97 family phage portal protein
MRDFQDNFFNNGAVPGLVIKTPDTLSPRIKERMKEEWRQTYRPQSGGRNPMVLDGGMSIDSISNVNFKELDFGPSIDSNEKIILKALGVPPVLIDSGNNANIRPNHRVYYLETIIPIIKKINSAFQMFFGFEIYEDVAGIPALQPELKDEAAYYSTLVNGGIITPDEARTGMGMGALPNNQGAEIRIPQNIAGSAANPSQGGRPPDTGNEND